MVCWTFCKGLESGAITVVARDLTAPSPLASEILNAAPYAFLDDAPLEERRTRAVQTRHWNGIEDTDDLAKLDPEAIAAVRAEAWPRCAQCGRDARGAQHPRLCHKRMKRAPTLAGPIGCTSCQAPTAPPALLPPLRAGGGAKIAQRVDLRRKASAMAAVHAGASLQPPIACTRRIHCASLDTRRRLARTGPRTTNRSRPHHRRRASHIVERRSHRHRTRTAYACSRKAT